MNTLLWFMKNVPGIAFVLDMGNFAFSDENVLDAFELLKDYIAYVHCKDRGVEKNSGNNLYNKGLAAVPTGAGYIPVADLVKKLRAVCYTGGLAIEHFNSPDQFDFMQKSAQFLLEQTKV